MSASEDPSGGGRGRRLQQAPGLWRTGLQQHDLSAPGSVVVQQRVEIGPEATPVKHTRPGEEIIYVVEGSLEYQVEDQPHADVQCRRRLDRPGRDGASGAECRRQRRGRTRHIRRRESKPVIALAE